MSSAGQSSNSNHNEVGYLFPHGCRITHGHRANIKQPFSDIDLQMHELSPSNTKGFKGQLGVIEFNTEYRLPRHIHMSSDQKRLTDERILILNGVALVEIAGEYFVVAPGSLVETVGGVPHTFTACAEGVELPDGIVSTGTFTMVYEYEEPTTFYPTQLTKVVTEIGQYQRWAGDLNDIRFPFMSAMDVVEKAHIIFNREKRNLKLSETEGSY